jgi:hypothetical protein
MANLVTESFDWFPAGQNSTERAFLWGANNFFYQASIAGQGPADVVTGRFGYGQAAYFSANASVNGFSYVIPFGAPIVTGFIGCAMFIYPANTSMPLIQLFDSVNNTCQVTISFEPNGVIKAYQGNGRGGLLYAASYAGVYQQDEWFHVEIKGTIDAVSGYVEVRINTVPVLSISGIDTKVSAVTGFDSIVIGDNASHWNGATLAVAYDDLFVNDTSGSSNNSWSGNLRIFGAFMIANGATDNFTIGGSSPAPTNWQSVLNQALDDTKYVYSSTVGNIDLYEPNPVVTGPLVRALQVRMALRQDDATQRVARAQLRIGTTVYSGVVDQYTNQTYTLYKERWNLSPATGVTFTGSEVNGLQAGVKVQA